MDGLAEKLKVRSYFCVLTFGMIKGGHPARDAHIGANASNFAILE